MSITSLNSHSVRPSYTPSVQKFTDYSSPGQLFASRPLAQDTLDIRFGAMRARKKLPYRKPGTGSGDGGKKPNKKNEPGRAHTAEDQTTRAHLKKGQGIARKAPIMKLLQEMRGEKGGRPYTGQELLNEFFPGENYRYDTITSHNRNVARSKNKSGVTVPMGAGGFGSQERPNTPIRTFLERNPDVRQRLNELLPTPQRPDASASTGTSDIARWVSQNTSENTGYGAGYTQQAPASQVSGFSNLNLSRASTPDIGLHYQSRQALPPPPPPPNPREHTPEPSTYTAGDGQQYSTVTATHYLENNVWHPRPSLSRK